LKLNRNELVIVLLYLFALIMWLTTISTTYVVNLSPNDFLGILSKFPIYFWISLVLMLAAIKKTYDGENLGLFAIGLVILILILFGTYSLVESNARFISYYPSGMAKLILENGQMSVKFTDPHNVYLYYSGHPFFSAIVAEVTNINLDSIIKYGTIFLVIVIALLATSLFKMILHDIKLTILASSFFIAFFWIETIYFCPQLLAYLMLIVFLNIFAKIYIIGIKEIFLVIILIVLFTAINFTHPLTAMSLLTFVVSFILLNFVITKKIIKQNLLMLFSVIYISWMIYIAAFFFSWSLGMLLPKLQSVDSFFSSIILGRSISGGTLTKTIVFDTRISLLAFSFALPLLYFSRRAKRAYYIVKGEKIIDNHTLFTVSWLLGVFLLFPLTYGGEIVSRIYMFSLLATVPFIVLTLKEHSRLAFAVLSILVLLHPIAYAGDECYKLTPDSELAVAKFFAITTTKYESVFLHHYPSIFYQYMKNIYYYDPYRTAQRRVYNLWVPPTNDFDITKQFKYLIRSGVQNNAYTHCIGYNPVYTHIDEINSKFNKIYENNEYTAIYLRRNP